MVMPLISSAPPPPSSYCEDGESQWGVVEEEGEWGDVWREEAEALCRHDDDPGDPGTVELSVETEKTVHHEQQPTVIAHH